MARAWTQQLGAARHAATYEFGVTVEVEAERVKVVIDHRGEERAATYSEDLDTALKMALPYIATCCTPDPFDAFRDG